MVLILIILLIILIRRRKSNQKIEAAKADYIERNYVSIETKKINDEILAELDKKEPDYEKLKALRAKMEKIKSQEEAKIQDTPINSGDLESTSTRSGTNGLTIALYIGSLLVLAGVGGLVASGAKEAGLLLLITMTVIFYGGGILIRNNETLKMASYVFVGTGMMILPFLGLLIYDISKFDPSMLWMIMSAIGVPMYIYATYVMQSRIFCYFALAGFVSLSCSLASVMGLALVWYFVFVMVVGIIFNILYVMGLGQQLGVMQKPMQQAGEWLPIATLITSFMAVSSLKEVDYVIILGVALLHLIFGYITNPSLIKENFLRLMLPAWAILFVHLLSPSNFTIGVVLGCAAIDQAMFIFFNVYKGLYRELHRNETEIGWMIITLISFVAAGVYIGSGDVKQIYAWTSIALVIDSALLVLSRFTFKQDAWYLGLVFTGIALPITITEAVGPGIDNISLIHTFIYILEMAIMEALFWKNDKNDGDVMTVFSVGAISIAALVTSWSDHLQAIVLMLAAAGFWVRGYYHRNKKLLELAVYYATAGLYFVIDWIYGNAKTWDDVQIKWAVAAHLIMAGFIVTSYLWGERKVPNRRILTGSLILMIVMGIIAIMGASWAMVLFLIEVIAIMLFGLFSGDKAIRNAGAVGVFLAVLWFTKSMSFVWPFLLGIGIIITVVFILLNNGQQTPPKISGKQ